MNKHTENNILPSFLAAHKAVCTQTTSLLLKYVGHRTESCYVAQDFVINWTFAFPLSHVVSLRKAVHNKVFNTIHFSLTVQ